MEPYNFLTNLLIYDIIIVSTKTTMIEDPKNQKEAPEGQLISNSRAKIERALPNHQIDKMRFYMIGNTVDTTVRVDKTRDDPGESFLQIICRRSRKDSRLINTNWRIAIFAEGHTEPIEFDLSEFGDATLYLTEEGLGFDPCKTPFNYIVYPTKQAY